MEKATHSSPKLACEPLLDLLPAGLYEARITATLVFDLDHRGNSDWGSAFGYLGVGTSDIVRLVVGRRWGGRSQRARHHCCLLSGHCQPARKAAQELARTLRLYMKVWTCRGLLYECQRAAEG